MPRHSGLFLAVVAVLGVTAALAVAIPYEPVFRLVQVNGEVTVKAPGSSEFVDAQEGKAYPYGTSVLTGKRGAVTIVLADNNSCQVGPMASLVLAEDSIDPTKKTLLLEGGKVDVSIEEENRLSVATPCSSADGKGGAFTAEVKSEADLKISVFSCASGAVAIMSDMFQIPLLDADDFVSVSCAQDQTFIRIKDIKGQFDVSFADDTGTPRTTALEQNGVVKIWRRKADTSDATVVTVLIVAPDGSLTEAVNYSVLPEAAAAVPAPAAGDEAEGGGAPPPSTETDAAPPPSTETDAAPPASTETDAAPPAGDDDDDDDRLWPDEPEWGPETDYSTTTPVIPSFTPVGLR